MKLLLNRNMLLKVLHEYQLFLTSITDQEVLSEKAEIQQKWLFQLDFSKRSMTICLIIKTKMKYICKILRKDYERKLLIEINIFNKLQVLSKVIYRL